MHLSAEIIQQAFLNNVELSATGFLRKIAGMNIGQFSVDDCEKTLKQLATDGVLRMRISLRDPVDQIEMRTFDKESLYETFLKSKNPTENPDSGISYPPGELIRMNYFSVVNPQYVYPGVENTESAQVQNVFIIGIDTVSFSKNLTDKQLLQYNLLTNTITIALNIEKIMPDQIIAIPTGDGYFLLFKNYSITGLFNIVCNIQKHIQEKGFDLPLRMGIHAGNVYEIKSASKRINAIGHSLNFAARVMSFGKNGHILVSREIYRTFIEKSAIQNNFHALNKEYEDKHGEKYEIMNFLRDSVGNREIP